MAKARQLLPGIDSYQRRVDSDLMLIRSPHSAWPSKNRKRADNAHARLSASAARASSIGQVRASNPYRLGHDHQVRLAHAKLDCEVAQQRDGLPRDPKPPAKRPRENKFGDGSKRLRSLGGCAERLTQDAR
eukprot:2695569-Pleurochrysis_carterae.AAC.2